MLVKYFSVMTDDISSWTDHTICNEKTLSGNNILHPLQNLTSQNTLVTTDYAIVKI